MKKSSFFCTAIAMIMFFVNCGGGGSGDNPSNECSCGAKTSEGSGMTLSVTKSMFSSMKQKEFVPGELLVKFKEGTSQVKAAQIMNSLGNRGIKSLFTFGGIKNSLFKKVKLKDDASIEQAVRAYNNQAEVEYAEPNYIYRALTTPNDPNYSHSQWGLNNTGQTVNGVTGTSGKDIGAEAAWSTITDCSSIVVAVLDTGINYNHRDLKDNLWDGSSSGYPLHGKDFVDNDNNPIDLNGHGTHCAGIIGANGNNGIGLTGVCWKIKLMAVRVLDATGSGTLDAVADGIIYAVDSGAHIISASLGGPDSFTMKNAVEAAKNNGVIIIAAAGNNGENVLTYPAAYPQDNVIAVAAIDQSGSLAYFSNYGTWVDIAAPGVNILSTWPGQSIITDYSITDWTMESGWGTGTYSYSGSGWIIDLDMLTNPPDFGIGTYYADNMKSMAYKIFNDLNAYGPDSAVASFVVDMNLEYDTSPLNHSDYLYFMYNENEGRPDPSDINAYLAGFTGSTSNELGLAECDLTPIMKKGKSLGFLLSSNENIHYKGAGIALFNIRRLYHNTTACLYLDGTSMATPHVAGVAAMCIQRCINLHGSYDKNANYLNMINAILNGASTYPDFGGRVAFNRMLNANNALNQVH